MALSAQATKISIDASKKPAGFTDPGGTNLSSTQPKYSNLSLSVLKATVENATKATTFDQIRTNGTIGLEKQVLDKLALEMDDAANTVTYNIDWKEVRNNQINTEEFYSNVANSFICIVDVYINLS